MPVKEALRTFILENFLFGQENPDFTDGASLLENGLIDSTGVLELVAFVEEKYGISVADEELLPENFDSVDNLANYVGRKSAA
ncbi:MAG TPA: acyl carrier protein [bacterium]